MNIGKVWLYGVLLSILVGSICLNGIAQSTHPAPGELFRDDVIPRIDISLPADSLDWILDPANKHSDYHFHARFVFDNGTIRDTLEDVGFRIRGNFARNADKKSFKVSFNTYVPGRQYYGVEKMNLNGQHNDPSIVRAKLCSELSAFLELPTMRVNHVLLYINNDFFGVYTHVEHIDEEFVESRFGNKDGNLYKCLWPANLNYLGNSPNDYKASPAGRRTYDLKTNVAADDYSDIANFIITLNNASAQDLACELEKILNVDGVLRMFVFDMLSGNWDGHIYNKNNFYLYHNPRTGLFEYIPYDLDNTFGIDWVGRDWGTRNIYTWSNTGEQRPLFTRLMQVPEYKKRFSYYMSETLNKFYVEAQLFTYLDNLKASLLPHVMADTYYPLDFGFTVSDFQQAFEMALPFSHIDDYGVKNFITARRNSAGGQLQLSDISPIISQLKQNHPTETEAIRVRAMITDDQMVDSVSLCYYTTDPNAISCVPMYDDGMHQDGIAGDGQFGVEIPPLGQSATIHYYLIAKDNQLNESRHPLCDHHQLFVGSSDVPLAINEFLASNQHVNADENGEYDDWVELYNYGNQSIYLGDKYLSDNQEIPNKWQLPDTSLRAGDFLLIWTDNDQGQGKFHTTFKLRAAGEFIGLFDTETANFARIDGIEFGSQQTDISYGRIPNGIGSWQSMTPTPAASNMPLAIDLLADQQLKLELAPNPFSDILNLQWQNPLGLRLKLVLTDLTGKIYLIRSSDAIELQESIQLADLPAGMYLVSLYSDDIIFTRKMLKY